MIDTGSQGLRHASNAIPFWSLTLEISLQPGAWNLELLGERPSPSVWQAVLSDTCLAVLAAKPNTRCHPIIGPTSPIALPGMLALAFPARLPRKAFRPGPIDTVAQPICAAPQ